MSLPINQIIQGDCLEVMKSFPDKSVDLVLTDPPYNTGMTATSSSTRLKNFFNDSYTDEDYLNLVRGGVEQMYRVLKDDRAIYVFINWKKCGLWMDELNRAGFKVKNLIVWDKVIHGLNYMNYAYTHEFIIFATKGSYLPQHKENNSPYWKDVWSIQRNQDGNQDSTHHETVKSLSVVGVPIIHGSNPDDLVLDPFSGSGTTAVACRQLNRRFVGIELNPDYVSMSNERIKGQAKPLF